MGIVRAANNTPYAVRRGQHSRAPAAYVGNRASPRHGRGRQLDLDARIRRVPISLRKNLMRREKVDPTGSGPIAISADKSPCAVRHRPKRRAPTARVGVSLRHGQSRRIEPVAQIRRASISRRKNLMRPENADRTDTAPTTIPANKSPCAVSKRRKHTASASNAMNPAATRFAIAVHAGSVGGLHLVKASNCRSTKSNGEQTQP